MLSTLPLVELSSSSSSREAAIFCYFSSWKSKFNRILLIIVKSVFQLWNAWWWPVNRYRNARFNIIGLWRAAWGFDCDRFCWKLSKFSACRCREDSVSALISVTSFLELSFSSTSSVSSSSYSSLRSSKSTVFPSSLTSMSSVSSRR